MRVGVQTIVHGTEFKSSPANSPVGSRSGKVSLCEVHVVRALLPKLQTCSLFRERIICPPA